MTVALGWATGEYSASELRRVPTDPSRWPAIPQGSRGGTLFLNSLFGLRYGATIPRGGSSGVLSDIGNGTVGVPPKYL